MDVVKKLQQLRERVTYKAFEAVDLTPDARSKLTINRLPTYPMWYFSPILGIPRTSNIAEMREFAKSAWVQMVTNAIIKAVLQTPHDIVVDDDNETDEEAFKEQIKYIKDFLDHPNREVTQDFSYLLSMILPDILEINTGVLFLNGEETGKLLEMIPYDGSTFLKQQDAAGFVTMWYQYSYRNPMNSPKAFKPWQIASFQERHLTYAPYGYSRLEGIQQVVELLDQATRFNKEFFLHDAMPALIINIPSSDPDALKKFKNEFLNEHEGRNSRFAAVNVPDLQSLTLTPPLRDMEWLDGQKWYMHLVFATYGVSPTEVGFTDSTGSKNVQEGQVQLTIKNAHVPYLHIIERIFNRQIIPWILGEQKLSPAERSPLKLKFFVKDPEMEAAEAQGQRDDVAAKILTINEVRKDRGLPSLEHDNANNPFNESDLLVSANENNQDNNGKKNSKESQRSSSDRNTKSFEGSSYVPLSKRVQLPKTSKELTYEKFFDVLLEEWETEVTKALHAKLQKNMHHDAFKKDFSLFISALVGTLGVLQAVNLVRHAVQNTMEEGRQQAEKDLDMNIPITLAFERKIVQQADQQLDGYTMKTGKRWPGIKGVGQQLQQKILNVVNDGMQLGKNTDEIVTDVQELFTTLKRSKAQAIVVSESHRMQNVARLQSYYDSGVPGRKQWVAFPDAESEDICPQQTCASMNGQVRELDEDFTDNMGVKHAHGPAHPHCRCFVRFVRAA